MLILCPTCLTASIKVNQFTILDRLRVKTTITTMLIDIDSSENGEMGHVFMICNGHMRTKEYAEKNRKDVDSGK